MIQFCVRIYLFVKSSRFFLGVMGLIVLFVLFLLPAQLFAKEWVGQVVRVIDGDSLVVSNGAQSIKIRLAEVDTPEPGQPFANEAKAFVVHHVDHLPVQIREKEPDRYGRTVAWVTRPGKEELGVALVRAGLAWRHKYYSKSKQLMVLEADARRQGKGLWSQPDPMPPWVWKQKKHKNRSTIQRGTTDKLF